MRYVIIGNSAAGVFAAEAIRRIDGEGQVDILSDEPYRAYARCLTSYYLTGDMPESRLYIRDEDFYNKKNLSLHTGQKAVKLDPELREVLTDAGKAYRFDRLLIATGAAPAMPGIPGLASQGVFALRTLADAKGILAFSGPGKRAVVVGGGFVALKAAYALLKAGMEVTCLISSGQILSQMLDRDAADMIARRLTSHGLTIKYHTDAAEILAKSDAAGIPKVTGVRLSDGEEVAADLILIGKGVTPNTGFLRDSGVQVQTGVVVDKYLQTNLSGIYAAGDVAQGYDIVSGETKINAVWPNAAEQGTIAGLNMAGQAVPYAGSIGMNSVDFYGLSTIAAGQARAEGDGYEVVKLFPADNSYCRLVFKDDVLVGYIMVGDTVKAGVLTSLIKEKIPLGKMKEELKLGHIRQKALW